MTQYLERDIDRWRAGNLRYVYKLPANRSGCFRMREAFSRWKKEPAEAGAVQG